MVEEHERTQSDSPSFVPRSNQTKAIARHAMVLCVFLFALGFPGKLANLFGGEKVNMLLQYGLFALQIIFMLLTSADRLMDIKIVDLKKEYTSIYLLAVIISITSMIVTHDHVSQLITCLRLTVTALFALWIINWYDVKHILTFTYWAQSIIVLCCLLYMFLVPGQAYAYVNGSRSFVGIFPGKNVCGAVFAFGLTMQAALLRVYWMEDRQPSLFFYLILICQLLLLVLSRAFGSLISAFVPIAYIMVNHRFKGWLKRLPIGAFYVLGSVGFLFFALNLMYLVSPILESFGKDATLTGRIPMWEQHINTMLSSHTFTGYGYGMFWENDAAVTAYHAAFEKNSWASSMSTGAHNELIELWLDTGLIGIAAYYFMILNAFRHTDRMKESVYVFCVTVMMGAFIKGLTERVHSTASYWTLYIFLSCGLALKSRAALDTPQQDIRS